MDLKLFHLWACPYSAKVRDYISSNNLGPHIDFIEIDEEEDGAEELMNLTGKQQVPCLVINGSPLLESEDIIRWLANHLLNNSRAAI